MTWTATAGRTTVNGDVGVCTNVQLTNGVNTVVIPVWNDGSQAGLTSALKAKLAQRDQSTGAQPVVPFGTVLDLSTPVDPGPTQAQTDQATWQAAYQKVLKLQRGLASGLSAITQQNVTDAQAALNALAYLPAYEALL